MKPILEIKKVSKKYRISAQRQPYLSIRESVFSLLRPAPRKQDFWALDDVSFDVMPGDTVGIIGRNGAGKSTLLKILSRITPPTRGAVTVRGHMASLLEVGTGFHPELTGRENIFLNGSILGMRRNAIKSQFDAIVDFAGVAQFVDTPLKHYSSGMQLRLAFAVAAFLEPEILVIDEVLAVGDSEFQKKCLGKMKEVSTRGRTVLFVSHDLTAVSNLTTRSVYLKSGRLQAIGSTPDVIANYVREGEQKADVFSKPVNPELATPQVTRVSVETSLANNTHVCGDPLTINLTFFTEKAPPHPSWVSVHITDHKGRGVIHLTNGGKELPLVAAGKEKTISVRFPRLRLYKGSYLVSVYLSGPPRAEVYERLQEIVPFDVVMNGSNHEFGWLPDICAYLEENEWTVHGG